jgi:hypothetical protein
MLFNITRINWASVQEAVPAFLTLAVMPLTYSIAYGLVAGIMSYVIIHVILYTWNLIHASAFRKTFPADVLAGANGSAPKAAWHLTFNPPLPEDLVDDVAPVGVNNEATLRAVTFRLHTAEAKLKEMGVTVEEGSDEGSAEAFAGKV